MGASDAVASISETLEDARLFLKKLREELPSLFRGPRRVRETIPFPGAHPEGGPTLPYQGGNLRVDVVRDGFRRSVLHEAEGCVRIRLSQDDPAPRAGLLEAWYRGRARAVLEERTAHWGGLMGLTRRRIFIKDQRTLWGSASRDGNLNFNWRLLLAPPEVLDYVVIHELAHLRFMDHSKRFWGVVADRCPDFKARRRWLRENSGALRISLKTLAAGLGRPRPERPKGGGTSSPMLGRPRPERPKGGGTSSPMLGRT